MYKSTTRTTKWRAREITPFSFFPTPELLRLKRLHWAFEALLEQPMPPTAIIIVCAPLLDARSCQLESVAGDGFERGFGADTFAAERFGEHRQPIRQRRTRQGQIPHVDCAIERSGEKASSARTELGAPHLVLMKEGFSNPVPGSGIPEAGRAFHRSRGQNPAVRAPPDRPNAAKLAHRFGEELAGSAVPNPHDTGLSARGDGPSVRAETRPQNGGFVAKRRQGGFSGGGVPKLHRAV